jgi:acetyl esterase/lipase
MSVDRRALLLGGATATLLASSTSVAARRKAIAPIIPLWPDGLPEAIPAGLQESAKDRSSNPAIKDRVIKGIIAPRLEMVQPKRANGASIIIMPGGGYRYLAWDKEGPDLANWFAARGVTAFSLAYRLPQDGWEGGPDTPLADAQRAVRMVRSRSNEWGLDPLRIAVMGFSAGGHLCANVAAQFERRMHPARDAVDALSARPDFAAPIYPGVLMDQAAPNTQPGVGLFGKALSLETLRLHSPHLNVPANAPPHIMIHAEDDPLVGPEHSLALRAALRAQKIPVETHLFAKGGHGFAMRNTIGLPLEGWPERVMAFGRSTGWIV